MTQRPDLFSPERTGTLTVRVGMASGITLPYEVEVRLYSHMGMLIETRHTQSDAQVTFGQIPVGEYRVEAIIPGYARAVELAAIWYPGVTTHIFMNLQTSASTSGASPGGPSVPVLAPKARTEADKGAAALRANNLEEAQRRLERVLKLAPGHPSVNYLAGVLCIKLNDLPKAKAHLEKTFAFLPKHLPTLMALGSVLYKLGDYRGAIETLEKAIVLDASAWYAHWTIGAAYYHDRQFEKARAHAARALELTQGKEPQIHILHAQALNALGESGKAIEELEALGKSHPYHPSIAAAERLLKRLRDNQALVHESAACAQEPEVGVVLAPAPTDVTLTLREWAPEDVDEKIPPVQGNVACSLEGVLKATAASLALLADNLDRIAATERLVHVEVDAAGKPLSEQEWLFDYVATIQRLQRGMISVDESRRPRAGPLAYPSRLMTTGLAAMALLVFHPYYASDFDVKCEGLGQWQGQPVWQLHFQQRSDRASRIRIYHTEKGRFALGLKGRAWIGANNHQVLRIETDLVAPSKEVGLEREHLAIDYAPVGFTRNNVQLWLPIYAELYLHFRGRRYHHRHNLGQFLLFSVETKQEIRQPTQ